MGKAPDAFRTISEVAEWLEVAPHVLRFWESKFSQVKPVKRAGGRRYYRPGDMKILGGIKVLLHDKGQTIKAVQSMIREEGLDEIVKHSPPLDDGADEPVLEAEAVEPDNVLAFEPAPAEPEPAAPAEVEPETEDTQQELALESATKTAPEDEPAQETPQPAQAATPEPEPDPEPLAQAAPKPRIIDIPEIASDTPVEAAIAPSPLALLLQADRAKLADKAEDLAPFVARLRAVRAQMTEHGVR